MPAQFREVKNGYLKSEVDTYILRLESEIENYQFEEKQQEQNLLEAAKQAEAVLARANKKAEALLIQAEEKSAEANECIALAVKNLEAVQNSFNTLARRLLIKEIEDKDTLLAANDIKNLNYEVSRKLIFLESVGASSDVSDEYALSSVLSQDKDIDRESRLLLQKTAADKTNRFVVIPLLIILFISLYLIYRFLS